MSDSSAQDSSTQYTVVARRYRPQSFEDLVGQQHIAHALVNAISHNRVGHAYLFTGARGVGKTSTARIFAKCLNCEQGPTAKPCNECDICQAVSVGEDVDVLEIDGASNRGIDEIRQLRSNAYIRPSRARYKIYIIDEVHMLTKEAFNALLKTLEEPPEHVKFIFCTTDPQKIPITVLSRCQRYDFSPVETDQISGRLAEICQSEGIDAEPAALRLLARRAGGSMRDSQSLLEQLFAFCDDKLTVEHVNQLLGTADLGRVADLVRHVVSRDSGMALQTVAQALAEGVDAGQLATQTLGWLRDVMAIHVGASPEILMVAGEDQVDELKSVGQKIGLETLLAMIQVFDQCIVRMHSSIHSRTLLEVAVVRACNLENLDLIADLIEQLGDITPARSKPAASKKKPEVVSESGGGTSPESVSDQKLPRQESPSAESQSTESQSTLDPVEVRDPRANANAPTAAPASSHADASHGPSSPAAGSTREKANEFGASSSSTAAIGSGSNDGSPKAMAGAASSAVDEGRERPSVSDNGMAQATRSTAGESGESPAHDPVALLKSALGQCNEVLADMAAQYQSVQWRGADRLVVTMRDAYTRELCSQADRKRQLEQAIEAASGRKIRLDFDVDESGQPPAPQPAMTRQQMILDLQKNTFVKSAIDVFRAELVDFRVPRPEKS